VVDACVARPDALDDLTQLMPLARLGSTWYVGARRLLGAAHCRAGQFDEAVRCYQEASEVTHLRARDWGLLALSHQRLGRAEEARRCLTEAARWIEEANRLELDDLTATRPVWGGWYEPMYVQRLLAEAKALVDGDQ
jgi:tetratricopeptide (TPR) repeat protein